MTGHESEQINYASRTLHILLEFTEEVGVWQQMGLQCFMYMHLVSALAKLQYHWCFMPL